MPIYEYQCALCGHNLELIQKISDGPETICPRCSKAGLIRLVSAAGFQLKGTGWYATDFKNKPVDKPKETSVTQTTTTESTKKEASVSTNKGETS